MQRRSALIVAVFAAVLALPAQASEKPLFIEAPVAGATFVNPCTGETVTLTKGTFQIVLHELIDSGGGFHAIAEGNAKGAGGVSSTGTLYRVTGGFWAELNARPGSTTVFTLTDVLQVISASSSDNFGLNAALHFTVNANGEPTAFVDVVANGTCRGSDR